MSSAIDLCGPSSDAKIEKRNKKRLRHKKRGVVPSDDDESSDAKMKHNKKRGFVPYESSDAKMKHNKERCFVPSSSDAKTEKRNKMKLNKRGFVPDESSDAKMKHNKKRCSSSDTHDAKIEKRNKELKNVESSDAKMKLNKKRGFVPDESSDAKMKHNKERCSLSDTHDAKIEKRSKELKNVESSDNHFSVDKEDFYFGRVYPGRYPFQKSTAKHPFLQPITEADRLKIQSDVKRELDAMELDAVEKREIQEIVRKTAAQNQINDRIRSNLGKLLDHHNDLMTELNQITKRKHKVKYLEGQGLILRKAIELATKVQFLQEEETTLKNQWLNNRQLLVEVESRIAELNQL